MNISAVEVRIANGGGVTADSLPVDASVDGLPGGRPLDESQRPSKRWLRAKPAGDDFALPELGTGMRR